jgi:hypothetical protein
MRKSCSGKNVCVPAPKEVIVGIAKHIWTNPNRIKGETFYFIFDAQGEQLLNVKSFSLEGLAETIRYGIGYTPFGNEYKIINAPGSSNETLFLDGYFGRPLVPAAVYNYRPLKRKQLNEILAHMEKLREKDMAVLDWT